MCILYMHHEHKTPCLPGAGGIWGRCMTWSGQVGYWCMSWANTEGVRSWHMPVFNLSDTRHTTSPIYLCSQQDNREFCGCAIYTKTSCKLRKYSWKKFYHKFQKSLAKSSFFLYTNLCCDIDSDEAWGCHAYAWVFRGANVKLANWRQVTVQVKKSF